MAGASSKPDYNLDILHIDIDKLLSLSKIAHKEAMEKISIATTDEERIQILMPIFLEAQLTPMMKELNHRFMRTPKMIIVSANFRKEGNVALQHKNYPQALCLYTRSLATAPYNSRILALAFGNRSAVLRAMGKFEDCITDIHHAINSGYPEPLCSQLLLREAQCYKDLGLSEKALQSFNNAKKSIEMSNLPNDKKIGKQIELEAEFTSWKPDIPYDGVKFETNIPSLSYGVNKNAPSISEAIKIEYNEACGRHLVAMRDLKTGDVVVVDKAYATFLDSENRWSHCNHCLQPSYSLLPCPTCDWALYCSEKCQQEAADEYHRVECPVVLKYLAEQHIEDVNSDCLLIRVVAKLGFKNLSIFLKDIEEQQTPAQIIGFNSQGQYDSNDFTTLYHLVNNIEKYPPNITVANGLKVLKMLKSFKKLEAPNSIQLAAILLRLYFSLCTNSYRIEELLVKKNYNENYVEEIGGGVFPTACLCNHSCNPNLFVISHGTHLVYRAARPIEKGSELTICYGSRYHEAPKNERAATLRNYYFDCSCEACINDWPIRESIPECPLYSDNEKDIENEIQSTEAEIISKHNEFKLSHPEENAMKFIFDNHKDLVDKQYSLMSSNGKCVSKVFLRIEAEQEIYYQSFGNRIAVDN